ncbi:MAG: hypothetical protein RJB21_464 [Pseudomonadota bacterium]|jgi:hypothetical protein
MSDKVFNASELKSLASLANDAPCINCASHNFSSWETILSTFDREAIQMVGTLQVPHTDKVWDEYHPSGTDQWSPNAPIAIRHHPYNSSDVYQCTKCQTVYLRYTEYGGYYVDERIRVVKPELVVQNND